MFTPDLDLRVITRCSKFQIKDATGVDTGDGTKWSGVSGLDPTTLTAATIAIINPSGTTVATYDVLSQIPTPVTDEFWFDATAGTGVDGLHNLVYTLKTSDIAITAFADYSSTVNATTVVTSTGHGMITGQYVDITGTTSYNGMHYVYKVDANRFYITSNYVADDGASTGTISYKSTFYPYVYCVAEAGIEKMYSNLALMTPGKIRRQYRDDANAAYGLLMALKSAISSSNTTALTNILAEINQILDYYDVDPNL